MTEEDTLIAAFTRPFSARHRSWCVLLGGSICWENTSDYNDGVVLPVAIDRYVTLAAAPSAGHTLSLQALDLSQSASFSLDDLEAQQDLSGHPLPGWTKYPAGIAWALQRPGWT